VPSRFLWFPFQALAFWRSPTRDARDAQLAELKAELARVRHAAAEALRAKQACLTRTTHELRTPLNAVLGYTQLLRSKDGLTAEQASRLAIIERSGQHMLVLVDEIMALTCLEAGTFSLRAAPLPWRPFLDEVMDMLRPQAAQKGLALRLDASALPDGAMVDAQRLRQVLLNLLANAVRFTDDGEVALRVWPAAAPAGVARVHFEVADTGVGIAPKDLPTLFQPFRQVGDKLRHEGGTGLGLTISRQLVRAMGGEIEVRSTPGEGSRFSFMLDLPAAPETHLADHGAAMATAGSRNAAATAPTSWPTVATSPPNR
jgi:signal transduction histidine kinase